MALGEVFGLAEVFLDVVELPDIVREIRRALRHPRQPSMAAACHPTVGIDRTVAEHLEVLSRVCARRVRSIEGVGHTDTLDWFLGRAIDYCRFRDSEYLENCWHHVNNVMELEAGGANISNR